MTSSLHSHSQNPNVYKHYNFSLDGMCMDVICYEAHTLSLRPFKFFSTALLIFAAASEKEQSKKLCIHNGRVLKLYVSSCKMFTFFDVLHETKQKVKVKKMQTISQECAIQTGNFNAQELMAECSNSWSGFFFC